MGFETADSHCHLTMSAFDADRGEVIERAARGGVVLFITVPARRGDDAACSALAGGDPRIFATAGLHPHEARLWDEGAEADLRAAISSPRVVAVGEIGLDFHYDLSPRDVQVRVFREQIGIARQADLPVVIHTRSAATTTLDILREERADEVGGVIHCFTEDPSAAHGFLDLGFFLSFSGIVTFPSATAIQEAARLAPSDRILVETDAPFLAPVPHRGQRNEPAFVGATVEFLSRIRSEDRDTLAAGALANCRTAFRIPTP